ncbi:MULTISPECIES: GMC oxidoreductase [Streptomyces]|uniref:GMC oxidoreductase n=1 Tax=Streptomyces TaxID=1883 RepID=UPI0004CD90CE|nr:GMC oxidoreductase [Streptomyces durhamensis]
MLAPASRGAVTLRSPRPDAAPRIVHNYLTTAEDRDAIVAGLVVDASVFPREPDDDEQAEAWLRAAVA